jgi:HD-GYP domain-containing protein (c-di-GMP phosphodiesterase class II)
MVLSVNTLVPLFATVLYSGLFLVVALATPRTESRLAFRWYLLGMVLWSLSSFLVYVDLSRTTLWFRAMISSSLITMIGMFAFALSFIPHDRKRVVLVAFYGLVMVSVSLFTSLVIPAAWFEDFALTWDVGLLFWFIAIPGYCLTIYSLVIIIQAHRKTIDVVHRNRLLYLIMGIGLMVGASLLNFTDLGQYPVDIAANAITALLIAYAILRFQLLDIRVVIRQGLLYSIPTIIIGAAYFLIITLFLNIFHWYTGIEIFLTSLIVAVVTAIAAEPLRVRAQALIDRMFFREAYNSAQMLQSLSSSVSAVLDIYKLTTMILEEVCATLHIPVAAFFLRDESTNRFQLVTQVGGGNAENIEFRQGHPLILWLVSHNQPLTNHDIEVLPQFQSLWHSERLDLKKLGAELYIPIKVHDVLIGIFLVSAKRSEQAYTMEDILTLTTVANQTAVAIENARLYTSEQTRLQEMDTLYAMAKDLVTTEDLNEVVSAVAEHAAISVQASSARIITLEENGDFLVKAIYETGSYQNDERIGMKMPLVAEHFFNWILQDDRSIVLRRNDPNLNEEEIEALFLGDIQEICLSPLKGVEDIIGLLILCDDHSNDQDNFSSIKLRLIEVISDYAASAIQRAFLHQRLEDTFLETIIALANAVDARDAYTGDHSQRMAELSTRIGYVIGLATDQIEALHYASILHDIGKIGVPDEILNKEGPLNKQEWVIMKEHPVKGAEIVAPIKYLEPVSPIIRAHHEKFDGTGYPYGLAGEDIPLGARILAVVDAYIAIRDERIYSKSHTHEEAIAELRRSSGSHFDPEIVDIFCKTITG